jgi:hypothetical protein
MWTLSTTWLFNSDSRHLVGTVVPVPGCFHEAGLVGKGIHFFDGKHGSGEHPAQHVHDLLDHVAVDCLDLDHLHRGDVNQGPAVRTNAEWAEAGFLGDVPRNPWGSACNRDHVQAGVPGSTDGANGARADGPVRPQERTVEVGRNQAHGWDVRQFGPGP